MNDTAPDTFQQRVAPWLLECFGEMIAGDREERNHRFIEEALELVQACGCTRSEAHQLVDYVFDRPVGEKAQEVGGVMVTLAALCLAQDLNMAAAGEAELARIWTKVEQIRAKQASKPKHSPLPAAHAPAVTPGTPPASATTPLYASLEHERGGYDLNKLASASTASDAPVVSDARALDLRVATPESPREVP